MDTLAHGTMSGILHALPASFFSTEAKIALFIFGFLCGILPDLISEYKARKGDNYDFYVKVHKFKIWWINILPGALLHIWFDQFAHGEGKRWYSGIWYDYFLPWKYKEMMWLETATWLFNLLFLWILFL